MGKIFFSKMHGLSNDFIIIDAINQKVYLTSERIRLLSDRYSGIGCDQILIVKISSDPMIDFYCRIYNADGSEVYQCGNGIRCVASFVYIKKLIDKCAITISTRFNKMEISNINGVSISVNMGSPIFDPKLIPFCSDYYQKIYLLFIPKQVILCGVVSVGNPHCIILVENVDLVPVYELGSILENHHSFPNKVNISFMQIVDDGYIKLRVYERGVGETQACGSAACAAVAVGIQQGLLNKYDSVKVNLPGGELLISWKGLGHSLYMIGSVVYVYDGYIDL